MSSSKTGAVIVAGGKGTRMGGGVPKQFLKIESKSILELTLTPFFESTFIDEIVIVLPEDFIDFLPLPSHPKKQIKKVVGGMTRQQSTHEGVKALSSDVEWVVVHDAARPFVSQELIRECLEGAQREGCAIAASPCKDTLKEMNQRGFVDKTLDRSKVWQVQTPQTFPAQLLNEILEWAENEKIEGTDEAFLFERKGYPVKIVPSSPLNFKITTAEDLLMAQALFQVKL